jgi:biotin carboxyl carrier protein
MDQQYTWFFDGEGIKTNDASNVTWEDHRFFTIRKDNGVYHGEILSNNLEDKRLLVKINHRIIEVQKTGALDALISSLGLDKPKVKKLKTIEAPMPGRIVRIAVQVGQEVFPGDEIVALEAMKMENVLKSEGNGIVKSIGVDAEQVVEKGMVLVEFE